MGEYSSLLVELPPLNPPTLINSRTISRRRVASRTKAHRPESASPMHQWCISREADSGLKLLSEPASGFLVISRRTCLIEFNFDIMKAVILSDDEVPLLEEFEDR